MKAGIPDGQRWVTDSSAKWVSGANMQEAASCSHSRDGNDCRKGGSEPERKTCRKEEVCRRKYSIFCGTCMQKILNSFSNIS